MTGSPIDGAPWWAKIVVYAIIAPIAAYDKGREIVGKVFKKKEKKK